MRKWIEHARLHWITTAVGIAAFIGTWTPAIVAYLITHRAENTQQLIVGFAALVLGAAAHDPGKTGVVIMSKSPLIAMAENLVLCSRIWTTKVC